MSEVMFNKCCQCKKMKVLRVSYGWSQREASDRCSTNRKKYWQWEKGLIYPRPSNIRIIARAFGVKVEDIFNDNDKTIRDVKKK